MNCQTGCFIQLLLLTILTAVFVRAKLGTLEIDIERHKECIDQLFEWNSHLADRFKLSQLALFCERATRWEKKAQTRPDVSLNSKLSTKQRSWLLGLQTCQGADCLQADETINLDPVDLRAERKEYRQMLDEERWCYQDVLNELKTEKIDEICKYDLLVAWHMPSEAPGAHAGPAFLPFHREYIKQMEVALRQIDPDVAIPYWDSTLDEGLPDPRHAILWTDEFLGNGDGEVVTGPFAGWETTQELTLIPGMKKLFRAVGSSPEGGFYTESDIEFILTRSNYEELTACVDPRFEIVHGMVHDFVGGFLADIDISPNDPSFMLHHAFVDYLFEQFRQTVQTREQRELDYPPNDLACNQSHWADASMQPFSIKNIDGLSNSYTDQMYYYHPRPRCSVTVPDCGSPYLYCNVKEYRCLSTIRPGGNCTGFEGTNICFEGTCNLRGVCETSDVVPVTASTTTTTTSAPKTTTTILFVIFWIFCCIAVLGVAAWAVFVCVRCFCVQCRRAGYVNI